MKSGTRSLSPLSQQTSKRSLTYALPKLSDGRTYVTEQMMEQEPSLRSFIKRTRGAWHHDFDMDMYITGALDLRLDIRKVKNDDEPNRPA